MDNSIWLHKECDKDVVDKISRESGISPVLSKLLVQRGIETKENVREFLSPSLDDISNPFGLKDMEKAVQKIEKSKKDGTKIFIHGDYDVDGITSTSLLLIGLKKLGIDADYHIPKREDGYGLTKYSIDRIKEKSKDKPSIIITVDCGITSFEEIDYANSVGLEVIVTDHHEIQKDLPKAYAVINPKRRENSYKFKELAGVGTAFMLLYALFQTSNRDSKEVFELLDLVAIGTISDVVPLIKENRIFVKYGLELMEKSKNIGIGIIKENIFPKKSINPIDIGFRVAPIFNAAGRLECADPVVKLLTTEDREEALEIFKYLDNLNKKRRDMSKDMLEEAENSIEDRDQNIIICANKSFHHGLVGIAAAKLVDKYRVPAIVLKIKDDGTATGSARGIRGVNLVEVVSKCKDILIKFGGHARAVGMSIEESKIDEFKKRMYKLCKDSIKDEDKKKSVEIECEVNDFDISLEFYNYINKLKPFGFGNPEPIFVLKNSKLDEVRKIGKQLNHLMFNISSLGKKLRHAVWFKSSDYEDKIDSSKRYNLALKIDENLFNGRRYPKIYIEDIKESSEDICMVRYYRHMHNFSLPIKSSITSNFNLDIGSKIDILNFNYSSVPIRFNNKLLGYLNGEASYILKEMSKNYFFNFKAEVIDCKDNGEGLFEISLLIDRSFSVDGSNDKSTFWNIKRMLIGDNEYNKMQKSVLQRIVLNKESVNLLSKRGRGIKTIALSVAIYFYSQNKKKSLFISKREYLPKMFDKYFILAKDANNIDENVPFVFLDDVDMNCDKLSLHFHQSESKDKSKEYIKDEIPQFSNLEIVPKDTKGNVFNRSLKIELKKYMVDQLKSGQPCLAERDILVLL